jgi:hypothetical protein
VESVANPSEFGFDAGAGRGKDWYVRTEVKFVTETRSLVVVFQRLYILFMMVDETLIVVVE